jgi:nitroreductase
LEQAFAAAVRAADHGKLQPWRFLVIESEGLVRLSDVYVAAARLANPEVSPAVLEKVQKMTGRAPMIVVAIACCRENPGVPRQEQLIACGCATQNLINAFFIQGYGAIWRSGDMTVNPYVREQLEVAANEEIIGFIYVGTPMQEMPEPPAINVNQFFKSWPAK